MNRDKAKIVRGFIEDLFSKAEEDLIKMGINLSVGNISFSMHNATIKVEAADIASGGQVQKKEVIDFLNLCNFFGLENSDLGKRFLSNGKQLKIIGLKKRSRKYPILVEDESGTVYKMSSDSVLKSIR